MLKVIGAGVGRTGTHSLELALERLLGCPCHHMAEVFARPEQIPLWTDAIADRPVDWAAVMAGYTAQVDWPGASFWPELLAANPEAPGMHDGVDDPWSLSLRRLMADRFSDRFDDPDEMIGAYLRHNDAVRAAVPPAQLVEWEPSNGWAPLCARLGVEVPAEPFPLTNTTDEFRQMMGMPPI